jgi:WXG100 family type VII secretion target
MFSVDSESLSTASAQLRDKGAQIAAALAGLEGEIGQLQSQWDGAARDAYAQAQGEWSARFAALQQVLEAIAVKTETIGANYSAANAAIVTSFEG